MTEPPARRSPITDPALVPVVGHDSHLPPVPAQRLELDWIARRLEEARGWPAVIPGDGADPRWGADRTPRDAAVLVPLVPRPSGLQVLLTRRTAHLRAHAGQISFPGGRSEPEDADVVATALREAQEEVGLLPTQVRVLGRMPVYTTVTRFVVTPVVAGVAPDHTLDPDPQEVAEAFEVPLAFLMDPSHHRRHRFEADGLSRDFLSMPWQGPGAEYFIWGATAAMLRNLYHLLAEPPA